MQKIHFCYKNSLNTDHIEPLKTEVENTIEKDNPTEFDYLSLSLRNHRLNVATSIPSNANVVQDYLKNSLIEIDPLACFELFTTKQLVTFNEMRHYNNHGKCGKSYMEIRRKSGLIHGFHYIHRHQDWSFTVVFGSSFKKNGFSIEDDLICKNAQWINNTIKKSLLILNEKKDTLIDERINLIHDSSC